MSTGGMHNDLRLFSAFTSLQPSYYGLACGSYMAAIFRHSDWLKLWKVATGKPLLCLPCFSIHTGGHVHTHTHIWKSWHYQLCYKNKNVKKMKQTVILSQTVVQTHSQLSTQSQQLHLFLNLKKKCWTLFCTSVRLASEMHLKKILTPSTSVLISRDCLKIILQKSNMSPTIKPKIHLLWNTPPPWVTGCGFTHLTFKMVLWNVQWINTQSSLKHTCRIRLSHGRLWILPFHI